ncbi:MAG: general secretion pathway protein A [Gammaproteobacteria bacterium]
MYKQFFGLKARPFSLLPDPTYLYLSPKHEVAMSILEYAVSADLALTVVSGEVGSGKTTIVRQLMRDLEESVTIGLISNTHNAYNRLMESVALSFGLPFKGKDKIELYQVFTDFLIEQYTAGRRTLLIVDEAQNLDIATLEEIRLLTNINADEHTLIQVLLVGQPELHDLLKRNELRQLAQRIGVMAKLEPLNEKETANYIRHRLKLAGGDPKIFHKNALRLVYWNSGGIPRVINTLCELALVYAYADRKHKVDAVLIADIARDRIDTGLYGSAVYDVETLKSSDDAVRQDGKTRTSRKARGKPIDEAEDTTVSHSTGAHGSEDRNVVDLVVDGSGPDGEIMIMPKKVSRA